MEPLLARQADEFWELFVNSLGLLELLNNINLTFTQQLVEHQPGATSFSRRRDISCGGNRQGVRTKIQRFGIAIESLALHLAEA